MSVNAYTITGRLGRDPELKFANSGTAVLRLNVAVGRRKKDGNEWTEETVWMEVTCFGDLAENAAETLSKGDEIIAQGYVEEPRSFEKKDGTVGVSLPFVANDLGLSLRWKSASPSQGAPKAPKAAARPAIQDEPF